MSDAERLARLTSSIFRRVVRGEHGGHFYADVDEAIALAREIRERNLDSEAHMREIERRMKRIKSRRNR